MYIFLDAINSYSYLAIILREVRLTIGLQKFVYIQKIRLYRKLCHTEKELGI